MEIAHVVLSPDGKRLASMDTDQTVRVWDAASGRQVKKFRGNRSREAETRLAFPIRYFPHAFSPDGKTQATGSCDDGNQAGGVRLWNVATGKELLPTEDHFAAITCLVFSADGKRVASGSRDQTVRLWDARNGKHLRCFAGHTGTIDGLALSPTGRVLASSSQDMTVRLWDVGTGRELHCLKQPGKRVASLCFLQNGKTLQVSDRQGFVSRYDVASGKLLSQVGDHKNGFAAIPLGQDGLVPSLSPWAVSVDGRMVATVQLVSWGSFSGIRFRICVWEVATGGLVTDIPDIAALVCSLAFSKDGWGLFAGLGDWWDRATAICCWDLVANKKLKPLVGPPSNIRALALSPDGTKLASGTTDTTMLIWDVSSLFHPVKQPPLAAKELARRWSCPGEVDAQQAYLSMYRLACSPAQMVPFLRDKLRTFAPPTAARLRKLIADLDDDTFAVRDKATKELGRLGASVEDALLRALADSPSLEARHRIQRLLRKLAGQPARMRLQVLRGISVLERIRTAKARQALHDLAKASPDTLLGKEAELALQRLGAPARK
jgi:WD40 repeat protein